MPHTEADASALLLQMLAVFGALVGRTAHFTVGGTRHFLNLYVVLVGSSAKSRKGTSWGVVRKIFEWVEVDFVRNNIASGLSSGEGLIHRVRDERATPSPSSGRPMTDPGVLDKRLVVVEGEFASVLKVATRDGNTLSPTLRNAWDGESLESLTKNSAEKATDPHIAVIGHISDTELRSSLGDTEQANGFANRFLIAKVFRSKYLPQGGSVDEGALTSEVSNLTAALVHARVVGEMRRDADADRLWEEVYPWLSRDRFGLCGAITARAEAQTMRLACLFALLDEAETIGEVHLAAALEVWLYCEDSANEIFGNAIGNRVADVIDKALGARTDGMTRTEISQLFSGNCKKRELDFALDLLRTAGRASSRTEESKGGRPVEKWFAVGNENIQ